ncbi:MAG: hypothetical protein M1840_006337 [Geoglossum simile]|nr:MAG: hypothetical protein M1840_006337 [Geoglossum simile]
MKLHSLNPEITASFSDPATFAILQAAGESSQKGREKRYRDGEEYCRKIGEEEKTGEELRQEARERSEGYGDLAKRLPREKPSLTVPVPVKANKTAKREVLNVEKGAYNLEAEGSNSK